MIYYKKRSILKRLSNKIKNIGSFLITPDFAFLNILKCFKNIVLFFGFILIAIYLGFVFLIPKYLKETTIENFINDYVLNETKFSLDFENLKIKSGYKFDVYIKADKLKLNNPDKTNFITLTKPKIDLNLLTLFFKYIDLNKISVDEAIIQTKFTKNKTYLCIDNGFLNLFENKNKTDFKLRSLNVLINKSQIKLYDENINKNFYVITSKIKFSKKPKDLNNFNSYKILTNGYIKSSQKNLDFNLKLDFKTKESALSKFKDTIKKYNQNPFIYADKFNFYAKSNIDLKIIPQNDKLNLNGEAALLDYTFNYEGIKLPKNNATLIFKGQKITADCDFYLIKNQFIKLKALVDISKNKSIALSVKSNEINLEDFNFVLNTFSKIFNFKNIAQDTTLKGKAHADLTLKSDFKNITSQGFLKIEDAVLSNKKLNIIINSINSDVNFMNNKINILNSSFLFNNSKFFLNGTIDKELNLKLNSDPINLDKLVILLQKTPILNINLNFLNNKDFEIKNGLLKVDTKITGELKKPIINSTSYIKDLKIHLIPLKADIFVEKINPLINPNNLNLDNIKLELNKTTLKNKDINFVNQKMILNISDFKTVKIEKTKGNLNGFEIFFDGLIENLSSKNQKIMINFETILNKNNKYLIIKNYNSLKLFSKIIFENDKLLIKNLDILTFDKPILKLEGEILNILNNKPEFNNLKINILENLSILSPYFDNISFDVEGNIIVKGTINTPVADGNLKIRNLTYKKFNLKVKDLILNLKKSCAYINIVNGKIFGFDFDLVSEIKILSNKIVVNYAEFSSNYIDFNTIEQYFNQTKTNNLPIEILKIKGYINSLEVSEFLLNSVSFEGNLLNNVLDLTKFRADIFNGKAQGNATINLKTMKTKLDVVLKEINVRLLSSKLKDISIAASGKLSAFVSGTCQGFEFDDVLRTFEGYVKFNINDGELSQFAKLEQLLQAGNILSQSFLKLTLNSTISAITRTNTGYFKTIEGTIKIKNSNATIQYVKSIGENMSLYIEGRFNLISKVAKLKVLGRIPSSIVNVMGNVGKFSTQNLVDKMSSEASELIKSLSASPIEKMLSIKIDKNDLSKIPELYNPQVGQTTREFIVLIDGLITSRSSIRYFKWNLRE